MSYVDISKEEFEAWLDSFGHPWKLKKGTRGCYLVTLSDNVAVHITSTLGGDSSSKGYAKASGQMRMVSLLTGRCLNKKAQGQKHFKRTSGWKRNWRTGADPYFVSSVNEPSNESVMDAAKLCWRLTGISADTHLLDVIAVVDRVSRLLRPSEEAIRVVTYSTLKKLIEAGQVEAAGYLAARLAARS